MTRPLPAYRGDDAYVFVSYSHADGADVFAEIRRLQDDGINVWYDTTGVSAGTEWSDEIARAIKHAQHFIFFITPDAVASEHCRRELNFAQAERRRVLAIHLQPTEVPDGLRLSLDNRQAILKHQLTAGEYRDALSRALDAPEAAASPGPVPAQRTGAKRRRWWLAAVLAAGVAAVALAVWFQNLPPEQTPATQPTISSIAVLPFRDVSPTPGNDWLAAGLATQLRTRLSQLENLRVVPGAALREREAGEESPLQLARGLSVSVVLDGTVQVTDDEARVALEMIDPATEQTVWSREFLGRATDPVELQESVLVQIARFLEHQLSPGSFAYPRGKAAQIAWFRYLGYGWGGNTPSKKRWVEEVLREDPDFATAYFDVFWIYMQMSRAYEDPEWVSRAREALQQAEDRGMGDDPAMHLSRAALLWQVDSDYASSEVVSRQALLGGMGFGYAQSMIDSGLAAEARPFMETFVEQTPYMPPAGVILALARALEGDVVAAHEAALRVSRLVPEDAWQINFMLDWTLPMLGRIDEAEHRLQRLRALLPREQHDPLLDHAVLALEFRLAMARGDKDEATALVEVLSARGWRAHAGLLYVLLDDDRAAAELEAASRPPFYRRVFTPAFLLDLPAELRDDPRVRSMLDAMGFTRAWRLELCQRITTLPPEAGIRCDPAQYALD